LLVCLLAFGLMFVGCDNGGSGSDDFTVSNTNGKLIISVNPYYLEGYYIVAETNSFSPYGLIAAEGFTNDGTITGVMVGEDTTEIELKVWKATETSDHAVLENFDGNGGFYLKIIRLPKKSVNYKNGEGAYKFKDSYVTFTNGVATVDISNN